MDVARVTNILRVAKISSVCSLELWDPSIEKDSKNAVVGREFTSVPAV